MIDGQQCAWPPVVLSPALELDLTLLRTRKLEAIACPQKVAELRMRL